VLCEGVITFEGSLMWVTDSDLVLKINWAEIEGDCVKAEAKVDEGDWRASWGAALN